MNNVPFAYRTIWAPCGFVTESDRVLTYAQMSSSELQAARATSMALLSMLRSAKPC